MFVLIIIPNVQSLNAGILPKQIDTNDDTMNGMH